MADYIRLKLDVVLCRNAEGTINTRLVNVLLDVLAGNKDVRLGELLREAGVEYVAEGGNVGWSKAKKPKHTAPIDEAPIGAEAPTSVT